MRRIIITILILVIATGHGCVTTIKHNQDMAAISAIEFAQAALIEANSEKAFKLLEPNTQKTYSKEKMAEFLSRINSPKSPSVVTATDFQPIPGSEKMIVILEGESNGEKFYYHFEMAGTEPNGYGVSEFFRDTKKFPTSAPGGALPRKHSTW